MFDITTNTLVRNGEDTIEMCLESVLPYVKKGIVTLDSRSKDNTFYILQSLKQKYSNLDVYIHIVKDPIADIIVMRNEQLKKVNTPWMWIVDSDEVYTNDVIPIIEQMEDKDVYAFQCWSVWNHTHAHKSTSTRIIPRIFKMKENMEWQGKFGKEFITREEPILLPYRYVHFTHVKNEDWRGELHQERTVDGKTLTPMPESIIPIVKNYYDKRDKTLQTVR